MRLRWRELVVGLGAMPASIAACGGETGPQQTSDAGPMIDAVPEAAYAIDVVVRGSLE